MFYLTNARNINKKSFLKNIAALRRTKKLVFVKPLENECSLPSVWPGWAIYCTLGNFLNPLATIILPKLPTFLSNFWKGVKSFDFSCEIIFGQFLLTFGDYLLVTLNLQCAYLLLWCNKKTEVIDHFDKKLFFIRIRQIWVEL